MDELEITKDLIRVLAFYGILKDSIEMMLAL